MLRERVGRACDRVAVYAYGDWLARSGNNANLAAEAALTLLSVPGEGEGLATAHQNTPGSAVGVGICLPGALCAPQPKGVAPGCRGSVCLKPDVVLPPVEPPARLPREPCQPRW